MRVRSTLVVTRGDPPCAKAITAKAIITSL
jgi:hypothetical protein